MKLLIIHHLIALIQSVVFSWFQLLLSSVNFSVLSARLILILIFHVEKYDFLDRFSSITVN
jgi:hypothetical protein